MAFMGLYTAKEVEQIKKISYENALRQAKVEFSKEKNKLISEFEDEINNLNKNIVKINADLIQEEKRNRILEFFLLCEYDNKIKRLEAILKKTKKFRIRKKCKNKILDYEMRKLAFER